MYILRKITQNYIMTVNCHSINGTLKSSEIFPPNYNVYSNNRATLGGGVFILVEKSITSVEQTSFITNGEIG